MNFLKKHWIVSLLIVIIFLSTLFIMGETSLKSTLTEVTQYIPPAQTQLAQVTAPTSGLIAHYTFDDTTNDSAGSNHGTAVGGPTYVEGKIGKAMSFDGVDDYVVISNYQSLNDLPNASFSVSGWVDRSRATGSETVMRKGTGSNKGWGITVNNFGQLTFTIERATTDMSGRTASNGVPATGWSHFVVVYPGGDESDNIKIYINGVDATYTVGGADGVGAFQSDSGMEAIVARSAFSAYGDLNIDDLRIYNTVLVPADVAALYALGGTSSPPPGDSPPAPIACTAFTYSEWGACVNGTQTRTITGRSPSGCTGGTPEETTQSCALAPVPTNGIYDVKKDGTGHFTTIQACATVVKAGETCLVHAGNYMNEYITIRNSGTASRPIVFRAQGAVVTKGFWLRSVQHVRVQGFEIDGTQGTAIDSYYLLSGIHITASSYIEIFDNYIHHINATGCVNLQRGEPSNHVTIRNNRIMWCTAQTNSPLTYQGRGVLLFGNENLVEGNDMSHTGTYVLVKGRRSVIRNNVWHDNYKTDFTYGEDHMDGVAYDCSRRYNMAETIRHILIENNYMYDSPSSDVKFVLLRDDGDPSVQCNPQDMIVRYNRIKRIGSYVGIIADNFKYIRLYNNTADNVGKGNSALPWSTITMVRNSPGGKIINNIFYDTTRNGGQIYSVDESSMSGFVAHNNLAYEPVCGTTCSFRVGSGITTEPNAVLNKHPQFLDTVRFAIPATSPAVDKGGHLTLVSSSDSGTDIHLIVDDAGMFQDGWAGVDPDWIAIGSVSNASRIVSINYDTNTITLANALTRTPGSKVYLFKDSTGRQVFYGSAPDIGAYEYNSGDAYIPPPTCTSFTYSSWSTCTNGNQTRTVTSSSPSGCTGGTPVLTQSCSLTTLTADFNSDGRVNSLDFSALSSNWNQNSPTHDLNKDGIVNTLDYSILIQQWTG